MAEYLIQHVCSSGVLEYIIDDDELEVLQKTLKFNTPLARALSIKNRDGQGGLLHICGEHTVLMALPVETQNAETQETQCHEIRQGKGQNSIPPSQR